VTYDRLFEESTNSLDFAHLLGPFTVEACPA
jgi:hypothetical protein